MLIVATDVELFSIITSFIMSNYTTLVNDTGPVPPNDTSGYCSCTMVNGTFTLHGTNGIFTLQGTGTGTGTENGTKTNGS